MKWKNIKMAMGMATILCSLFAGCGGGGETGNGQVSPPPAPSAPELAWDPPATFSDNTPLNPYVDLDYYEFYLRTDTNFTDNDVPVAQVAAVTSILAQNGQSYIQSLTGEFNLVNLLPFTQNGVLYYLSIKSVGTDGLKSGFSFPVTWSQT